MIMIMISVFSNRHCQLFCPCAKMAKVIKMTLFAGGKWVRTSTKVGKKEKEAEP